MPTTRVRVAGGGNTYVKMGLGDTVRLKFNSAFDDRPGNPLAQPVEIQPIGEMYPIEIATAYGMTAGRITITVYATWLHDGWVSAFMTYDNDERGQISSASPWNNFHSEGNNMNRAEPVDLAEVLRAQRENGQYITVEKYELDHQGNVGRVKKYENCIITNIGAQETVRNNTMVIEQTIEIMYTKVTVAKS